MTNLYEHIVQVLGTNESDEFFDNLIGLVGETPQVDLDSTTWKEYFFNIAGFALSFWKTRNCFSEAYLHLDTPLVRSGTISRYTGTLPCGILTHDTPSIVESKLGHSPRATELREARTEDSVKKFWAIYDVDGLTVSFAFTGDESILTLVRLQRQHD